MFTFDNDKHHLPHIHVRYQENSAVLEIPTGTVLAGDLPSKKMRMVQTWIDIHADELMKCWNFAVNGYEPPRIDPLR